MIDKLIIDSNSKITLTDADKFPYTYSFSEPKTHKVNYALSGKGEISQSAFANCEFMTSVKFPKEVISIKRRAFENCSRLNNVVIPETLRYIGPNVWDGCSSMTKMTFENPNPDSEETGITNFSEIPAKCKVFIPNDSKYEAVPLGEKLTPDTVKYFTKTDYNMYNEVPARLLNTTTQYYRDRWEKIGIPNNQTVEMKNEIPVEKIEFESQSIIINKTAGSETTRTTITYKITPENATNKKLYLFCDKASPVAKVIYPETTEFDGGEGRIIFESGSSTGNVRYDLYAESGVYDFISIRVS